MLCTPHHSLCGVRDLLIQAIVGSVAEVWGFAGMNPSVDSLPPESFPSLSPGALSPYIAMSSRIQADLKHIDAALKSCPNKATLKNGSLESWRANGRGISAVTSSYQASVFSDPGSGVAPWLHWRKSNTSKQLLGFMRAVIEAVAADAQRGALALPPIARTAMDATLHACIALLSWLFTATQSAALWPSMREWFIDQKGIGSLWAALAWNMTLAVRERATVLSGPNGPLSEQHPSYTALSRTLVTALELTNRLPVSKAAGMPDELALLPGLVASLSLLFSNVLPRDLAAGNAHEWDLGSVLCQILELRNRCVWERAMRATHCPRTCTGGGY